MLRKQQPPHLDLIHTTGCKHPRLRTWSTFIYFVPHDSASVLSVSTLPLLQLLLSGKLLCNHMMVMMGFMSSRISFGLHICSLNFFIHTYIYICISGIHRCATSTEYERCQKSHKSQKQTLDTEHTYKQTIRHYYITNMS
jgi:hypothetical protein